MRIIIIIFILLVLGSYYLGKKQGFLQGYQAGYKDSDKWYSDALNQPDILKQPLGRYNIKIQENDDGYICVNCGEQINPKKLEVIY